tara:strand:- start:280 stop:642 length:363 start_codon:yes stop_codon:yes gene_type:complete
MNDVLLRDIVHIIGHVVIYSLVIWQFVIGIWLILKWVNKNWKIKPQNNFQNPVQPVINIDGSNINDVSNQKNKKDLGVVDVDFKKEIFIDRVDDSTLKVDDVKKGKVKTQKNKLKNLIKK